jgi:hypothetical protein
MQQQLSTVRASNRRGGKTKLNKKVLQNALQSEQQPVCCKHREKLLQIRRSQKSQPDFSF